MKKKLIKPARNGEIMYNASKSAKLALKNGALIYRIYI